MACSRMRFLVAASLLTFGAAGTAGARQAPSDFQTRRAFKNASPGEQLQLLRQFGDPWQALAAALNRPSFREALARQGRPLELGHKKGIFVEDCSGLSVHEERVYRDRRLLLHPGGAVSVKDEHYSVIRAAFDAPTTPSRRYSKPSRDSWYKLGRAFKNPYLYPLVSGKLHRLGVGFTTADIASLVKKLESGQP